MKRKKLLSYFLSILLVTLMPVSILADTYYIDDGDIEIWNTGTQFVGQGGGSTVEDANPIITQHNSNIATDHKITVNSTRSDTVVTFTIQDININPSNPDNETFGEANGINIAGRNAEITVKGNNTIDAADSAIYVTSGDLTIKGDGTLSVHANGENAKIGSRRGEKMSGTIHITDDVTITSVNGSGTNGAVIGTGENGDLSGDIIIDGNATVNVTSGNGAAIGSGNNGDITDKGSITIGDNATVNASSQGDGSAIGSGKDGNLSGSITIEDDANVVVKSVDGAAIGSGLDDGSDENGITETGEIVIKDNTEVVAYAQDDGSAIGTGKYGDLVGTIEIKDDATVTAVGYQNGAGIGTGKNGTVKSDANITISDNADVTAYAHSNEDYASSAIGASGKGNMEGTITISGDSKVKTVSGSNGTAIGTGINSSSSHGQMTGKIEILDFATVTTETKTNANVVLNENVDPDTKKTTYTVSYTKSNTKAVIGESNAASHDTDRGNFTIGTGVTINNIKGSDIEGLKDYINYYVDENGNPTNIKTVVSKRSNNNNSSNNTNTAEEVKESKVYKKIDTSTNNAEEDTSITEETTTIIPNANNETSKTEEVVIDTDQITNTTNNIYLWLIPLFILLVAVLVLSRRRKTNS